ncbi:hypothetical protein M1555_01835 [Patescibacteria group bacterium]|nr:hypothetical protein [Patescibacteria group bacterium]
MDWPETEETPVGGECFVPAYLSPGQNILDQPPYSWVETVLELPKDYFVDDTHGYTLLLRAVAYREAERARMPASGWWKLSALTYHIQSRYRSTVSLTAQRTYDWLARNYPGSAEYLYLYWASQEQDWTERGEPTGRRNDPVLSYAGWAGRQQGLRAGLLEAGIYETAPDSFSTPDDIASSLPPKGEVNRRFRMLHSGALD